MSTMYWTNPETARKIVDITASISKIAEEKFDEVPMTANYSHTEPTLRTLDDVARAVEETQKEIQNVPGHPGDYMRATLKAYGSLVRVMAGDDISYRQAIRDIQEVELREIPKENAVKLSEEIDRTLTDLGYQGTVAQKIAAWQADKRIPADQVVATANRYLARSKQYAFERVLKLPVEDAIESVNAVTGVYWSGLSEYLGNFQGRLTFNIDRPWNAPTFACILTHEGYPGHHVYYTLWDALYQQGKLPMEAAFYLCDAPTNCLFEGVPEIGANMLGWDTDQVDTPELDPQEKAEIILAKKVMDLQRMLQQNGCFYYNCEGRSQEDVVRYMTADGWYSEIEANNTFRYFSNPYKKIYYPCYYYGRWIMQQAYDRFPKERRQEFFHMVYETPQTNSTLIKSMEAVLGEPFDPFASI